MRNRLLITMVILVLCANSSYAQVADNKDFAIWNSIGVKYSPIKKLKLGIEQHLRLKENASQTDEYFTEVQADFEFLKDLEIGGAVRFIRENDNVGKIQGYEKHFRYQIDLNYKIDLIQRLDVSFRLRYQNKRETDLDIDVVPTETLRFKTSFDYKIKNWPLDPEFEVELFNRKREGASLISDAKLSRYRLTFGTSYNLNKFGEFGISYRFQENTRVDNDFKTSILQLKYSYDIN